MIVKVKYENGVLIPLEEVKLGDGEEYLIELTKVKQSSLKTVKAEKLKDLTGIISIGGDAVKECKDIYE
jgi:predicted DNA-binding antitoxin AbrB/MazE fold protein